MDKEQFLKGLKDSLILWDVEQMFHTRLSDVVLEELSGLGIDSLGMELVKREDFEVVKQMLEVNRGKMDAALYADCMAELKEIKDDRRWLASKTGKRVMEIEHWLVVARQKAKKCFPHNDVVMGRDIMEEPDNLTIGIVARTREECSSVEKTIEGWQPPVAPRYKTFIVAEQR